MVLLHLFQTKCSYILNILMHGTERCLWSKKWKDFQANMITTRAEANFSRNNERQWNPSWQSLWHTVNSGHYCLWMHLSASLSLVSSHHFPLHLSLWATVEMNKKIPLMEAVWSFNVFWRNSLPWEKSSMPIFTNRSINGRCQSTLYTTHSLQSNLSSDRHNKAICI